ncbi:glycoside hydrolase 43 family protein [Novosphingobium sp. SG720]|uniref:glycoside hydrolase family 43 protein n=1 Tax=Novosphingobium sp. SG720 TaxID=2586998 RepID=UPI0014484A1C|nr:glycoside hydrolase 43 family protein [Novosphingobium sp. SG720]NKJ44529.1 beta-xylosidase [Novosphingobium sp. SG720]
MAIRSLTITLALLGTTPALAADTTTSALPGGSDGRWFADQGDGTYRNPVIAGDWSDPDVIRHGDDYYLVASSFTEAPGLPILHSRDLVNWTLLGHALPRALPDAHYATPRRGGGVWAPAIRFHDGRFLIYYPDPDHGIFVVSATDPAGPWTAPQLVDATAGAIDPAPFWDEDGTGWLVHAYALSRAGQANRIVLKRLDPSGTKTMGTGQVIIDGDALPPVPTSLGPRPWQTTEGPKLYKRDGWYYIFAPSGSVKGGWQGVFRSRSITGPYEGRDVMDQGHTAINGPHQGAWVSTQNGEDWFLHFQDRDTFGRVVHLQPMRWRSGWPVIGTDPDGDGRGEPVLQYRRPQTIKGVPPAPPSAPLADDDFSESTIAPIWQFGSNPQQDWASIGNGWLRLKSISSPADLYENGGVLSQRLPAFAFVATTRMRLAGLRVGERAGLAIHGTAWAWIGLERDSNGVRVMRMEKSDPRPGTSIASIAGPDCPGGSVWLRVTVRPHMVGVPPPSFAPYWPSMLREERAEASLAYSIDGVVFTSIGTPFDVLPGRWVGARIGLFAQAPYGTPAATSTTVGYAEFDWFRITRP